MTGLNKGRTRRNVIKSLGMAGLAGAVAGCSGGDGSDSDSSSDSGSNTNSGSDSSSGNSHSHEDPVEVGLALLAEDGSFWNQGQITALKSLDEKLDWLKVQRINQGTPVSSVKDVLTNYADQGYDYAIGGEFDFQNQVLEVSKNYENTHFAHTAGFKTGENMEQLYPKFYQGSYLAGIAAGHVTENNTIGYISAYPLSLTLRRINAFALGASSVNPDVTQKVRFINSWFDPTKETQATNSLIDAGVDVVATGVDSSAVVKSAGESDIWSVGMYAPMIQFGGEKYLTGVMPDWSTIYEESIRAIHEGTWSAEFKFKGFEDGWMTLDQWGANVSSDVKSNVNSAREKFANDDINVWEGTQFEGKSERELYESMDAFVDVIEGEVPDS